MIGWKRRLKYRRLIKNLINRPREPAISDFSSTPYPHHDSLPRQLSLCPHHRSNWSMLWLAGASDVINNLHLSRFDVTDALKCAWPGAYRAISAAPLPSTSSLSSRRRQPMFRTLNPRLMPRFLFSFFFSPLFSIRQLVTLTSLHRAGRCISEKWNVPWHVNWSKREIEKESYD